tara:strand:+ start:174 stop:428 length:255 start_codon:yes stop_codon:yes gene_type:complete
MTKKTYKPWTTKEHNRLVTMHENKLPIKEIAKALGRTVSSVNNRLAKIKVKKVPRKFAMTTTETRFKPVEPSLLDRLLKFLGKK